MPTPKSFPGTKATEVVARGIPEGPLTTPNRFYRAAGSKTGKYHATDGCSRLRDAYADPVDVPLLTTSPSKFCADCVSAPTDPTAALYVDLAWRALNARQNWKTLTKLVAGDQDVPAEPDPDAQPAELTFDEHGRPVGVTRTTSERVAQAAALANLTTSIVEHPRIHPDLRAFTAPFHTQARTLLAHLRQVVADTHDEAYLQRRVLVDLLGVYAERKTPKDTRGPVPDPKALPALCAGSYTTREGGPRERITTAWQAWTAEVALSGNLDVAAERARRAGSLADLQPESVKQIPTGPARTPAPADGSPWTWAVHEWHLAGAEELDTLIAYWGKLYQERWANPPQAVIVQLTRWNLDRRTETNASIALLSDLDVATSDDLDTGLVIAPGFTGAWLERFGTNGRTENRAYGSTATDVRILGPADPTDTPEVLETTLRLWDKPNTPRRGHPRTGLHGIEDALTAARGIMDNPGAA